MIISINVSRATICPCYLLWHLWPKAPIAQSVYEQWCKTCVSKMLTSSYIKELLKFQCCMKIVSSNVIRVPTLISEKSSMIFPWLLQAKIQISRQKKNTNICFCGPCIKCRINYRQTQTDKRTLTHTGFDQGQPTIELILLVIELIQEVKTTLVNLIKMGNRFSY